MARSSGARDPQGLLALGPLASCVQCECLAVCVDETSLYDYGKIVDLEGEAHPLLRMLGTVTVPSGGNIVAQGLIDASLFS